MGSSYGPERQIAAWALALKWTDVPTGTRRFVTDFFLDSLGCALAGVSIAEVAPVRAGAARLAGEGTSPVIGGGTASLLGAALVNGYLTTAATACDVHRASQCHIGPSTVPPALGVAEAGGCGGERTLTAVAAGLEVAGRVAMALAPPAPRRLGWHAPGVVGPFGGAVAAGLLLGLSETGLMTAMSLAASQAAGSYAQWGSPGVKFHQANGAGSGVTAAVMAASGFRASTAFFGNSDGGFLHMYSDSADPAALTRGLGTRYELERISLRRWPGATFVQSILTGMFELLERDEVGAGTVRRLTIGLSPEAYAMHGEMGWATPFTARLSARYIGAVVLLDRRCWLEQFTPERIADPEVDRIAGTVVRVHADPDVRDAGVRIVAELKSGERAESVVDVPVGDPDRRLSAGDLREKFLDAATPALGDGAASQVLDWLDGEPCWQARDLMAALCPGSQS